MRKAIVFFLLGVVVMVGLGFVTKTDNAQAGTLVFPTISPGSLYGGKTTGYSVSFQVASSMEATAQVRLIFPSSFRVDGATATSSITSSSTGSEIIGSSTVSGSEITIWFADGSVTPASETVEINNIPNIVSPASGGTFTIGIETRTQANELSDDASATAIVIYASPVAETKADTKPPVSTIDKPVAGENIPNAQKYVIMGTGKDASGISIVEVSVDGGTTWNPGQVSSGGGTYSWEYAWLNPTAGEYTVQVRATDSAGNRETPGAGVKATVAGLVTPAPTPTPTQTPTQTPTPISTTSTPTPPTQGKPVSEMTASEIEARIVQLQQQLISLLQQLVQVLSAQL